MTCMGDGSASLLEMHHLVSELRQTIKEKVQYLHVRAKLRCQSMHSSTVVLHPFADGNPVQH